MDGRSGPLRRKDRVRAVFQPPTVVVLPFTFTQPAPQAKLLTMWSPSKPAQPSQYRRVDSTQPSGTRRKAAHSSFSSPILQFPSTLPPSSHPSIGPHDQPCGEENERRPTNHQPSNEADRCERTNNHPSLLPLSVDEDGAALRSYDNEKCVEGDFGRQALPLVLWGPGKEDERTTTLGGMWGTHKIPSAQMSHAISSFCPIFPQSNVQILPFSRFSLLFLLHSRVDSCQVE